MSNEQLLSMRLGRREFLAWTSRQGIGLSLAGVSLPTLLAACGSAAPLAQVSPSASAKGEAIVGDVLDFALSSNQWKGAFGFVTFRLHKGTFNAKDVYFIRTDASDETYARQEKLVPVPKLAGLAAAGLTGSAYLVSGGSPDQATVLSSEPGQTDYTPGWRIHRVTWKKAPRKLSSVADVQAAEKAGEVAIEQTNIVLNGPVVKWSSGQLPIDTVRTEYLGPGQLLEPPDVAAMTVNFKLHECFPGVRYIVTDVSLKPMAGGMNVVHSPRLENTSKARATGRTNVFMNGLKGSGPMGFQPSVFDSRAGSPSWSPYWDHMTYAWKDGKAPRLLTDEVAVHRARDVGDLNEFPGTPDTKGTVFTVNCPVPVVAPNTFKG
jgi:hypothetical protein